MIKVRHEITINKPIEEVFNFLANPENNPKWDSSYLLAKITSQGPIGVGTTGKSIGLFLGRTYETTIELAEFSPPYNVAHRAYIGPARMETRNGFRKLGDRTFVMHDRRIRLKGIKRLLEPFIGKQIKRKVIADFEKLQLYFRLKASAGF
jgi:hypothetical protein